MAQTSLSGAVQVVGADLLSNSSVQLMALGAYAETSDGRGFRYSKVGATATVPGKMYVAAAWDSTNQAPAGGLAVSATAAIGATEVIISTSTTWATTTLLAGGYLAVGITPGEGYLYRIKSNSITAGAASGVIYLEDPLQIALTSGSNVTVVKHPNDAIIVSPASASTGQPVGVPPTIQTAGYYGWIQTHGPANVLVGVDTSISLPGVPVTVSASTAGAVIVATAILPTVGWAMQLMTATEYNLIYLKLD